MPSSASLIASPGYKRRPGAHESASRRYALAALQHRGAANVVADVCGAAGDVVGGGYFGKRGWDLPEPLAVRPHLRLPCYAIAHDTPHIYKRFKQMTLRTEGFARLDALIAEHGGGATGEEWLLSAFVSRISDGESPAAVSVGMGLPWFVLRRWLEDSGERMSQWELGKRCFADGLVWSGLAEARDAEIDTLGVSKFRAEYYQKAAERISPREWGNKTDTGAGGITVVVQRGLTAEVTPGGVLTILESQDKGYPVAGVTVDG